MSAIYLLMKNKIKIPVLIGLLFTLFISAIPCGPSYLTPVFTVNRSPEFPYTDYAAGKLGIIRPRFHRSVLFTAYRWLNNNGLTGEEQKAMTEVWKAEFRNTEFRNEDVTDAVEQWKKARIDVVGDEEKLPAIYVEREYGGYNFFPNCTRNAFETAVETLNSRKISHGSDDRFVREWVAGQDKVFENCSAGASMPAAADPGMPEWLQKDRAYQLAAASFYSMRYDEAKKRFADIATDSSSPWQETADYLVARTLIRQASTGSQAANAKKYYYEAEQHLQQFVSSSGKFSASAQRLQGLIKYRIRPEERVRELAMNLSYSGGNQNFRQDVIDYTWLMDKFEAEILKREELRKTKDTENDKSNLDLPKLIPGSGINITIDGVDRSDQIPQQSPTPSPVKQNDSDLLIIVYNDDYTNSWRYYVRAEATDEEAITEGLRYITDPMTDAMRERIRSARQNAYSDRFSSGSGSGYEGGYYGDEKMTPELLPAYLSGDDLTNWLFVYQMQGEQAYRYSLNRFKQTGAEIWLMSAISKAGRSSAELNYLQEAAKRSSRASLAFPTIAYNAARIYLEQNKTNEARQILDEALANSENMPASAVNEFLALRDKLSTSLDEYLKLALRKPFTFDNGGQLGSIDELIAEQKSWFNPEYNKEGREEYEREIDRQFANERLWQNRGMFDNATVNIINQHFTTALLAEAERSSALPDYMRERFTIALFTRALLNDNIASINEYGSKLGLRYPEMEIELRPLLNAQNERERQLAGLYLMLRRPFLTPFIAYDLGRENYVSNMDDDYFMVSYNEWWCESGSDYYDEELGEMRPNKSLPRPPFITDPISQASDNEQNRLREIGDAPNYMAKKAIELAGKNPGDTRIAEMLYIAQKINGWSKYGCGSNIELQKEIRDLMKAKYPQNQWTMKLRNEEDRDN